MRAQPVLPSPAPVAVSVIGLEHGRAVAKRRAAVRRFKNGVVSGLMFAIIAGTVAAAGWFGYQYFRTEQSTGTGEVTVEQRTTSELIDHLEEQPRWNGPGNPAFGVGTGRP